MEIAVWIASIVLGLASLGAGFAKSLTPRERLLQSMEWVEDFSAPALKLTGIAEILGTIGLFAPVLTGILPILTPVAAAALAVLQLGAAATHIRRREFKYLPANVLLLGAAVFVAVARFAGVGWPVTQ